jgi:hypothetical protein
MSGEKISFQELYRKTKMLATPSQLFVQEVCQVTHRAESTVRSWIAGTKTPDTLATKAIADHFHVDAQYLFKEHTSYDDRH